jgi:hypothetical protein|tara:strand:- start:167 stop:496 length:330 start_codon:yes stop_codon:yes gene_type:complete
MKTFKNLQEELAGLDKHVDDLLKHFNKIGAKERTKYTFVKSVGPKYIKILVDKPSKSVHAFIDKNTGLMYKPASFNAPAKGARFDLKNSAHLSFVYKNFDVYGSYLYKR